MESKRYKTEEEANEILNNSFLMNMFNNLGYSLKIDYLTFYNWDTKESYKQIGITAESRDHIITFYNDLEVLRFFFTLGRYKLIDIISEDVKDNELKEQLINKVNYYLY